ncbi:hypothetical protein BGP61_10925 [Escherichia coli]|nr:hypothetical protein [Escherichia coli]ORR92378.1 hypothetical protein BIQ82_11070 [Escherichia coli]ORR95984.1 hypothetical protein BGP66_10925 [Escherichia coli]ORS05196.1 hypothetical protein BGP65_10930 [Escherichia coli]ORS07648.1 hypothetical protein BGP64_11100 [Escherichia coli]
MSWLLGAKALLRYPFCPAPRRASFWEFTMQSNPMNWLIAALMALGALISFFHEPEGVQWLLLMWAQ